MVIFLLIILSLELEGGEQFDKVLFDTFCDNISNNVLYGRN